MAWYQRCWNVIRSGRIQQDLERELAFHVTERADSLQESGMSQADALRTARLQFGNFTTQVERTRDMDIHDWLESSVRNVRYALRGLAKTPAFTATVILTLALAIGANSAVFSAIYAVLLRPLPFPNGDQLVTLGQAHPKVPQPQVAPVRLEEWNRLNDTLQAITGYYAEDVSELSGELPEKLRRVFVAPRFLQVMGSRSIPGARLQSARRTAWRTDRGANQRPSMAPPFRWQPEHNRKDSANRHHRLADRRHHAGIVSLSRPRRRPLVSQSHGCSLCAEPGIDLVHRHRPFEARRDAGTGARQSDATCRRISAGSMRRPTRRSGRRSTRSRSPRSEVSKKSLWILFGSVSLLLLIACTNIAALLLSRATGRRHEISVRFSLGASRAAVAAQLLTEVLILALAGAALGLLLATSASGVFRALAKDLPRIDEIGLDLRVVFYSLACAIGTTLICGLYPAIRGTRRGLAGSLAHAGRSQVSGRNPMQFVLVGVQVAFAVTLLAGAGLLLRSFQELGRVSPGFEPSHVLTFHISTTWGETGDRNAGRQLVTRILDGLRATPGIENAATGYSLPGVPGEYQIEVKTLEGRAGTEPKMLAQGRWVTPGYFATMRIPLVAGEVCRDDGTTPTAMVNRSFANLYFGESQAIGRHLVQPGTIYAGQGEIRGIVGDARETGLDREPPPTVYWCATNIAPGSAFSWYERTANQSPWPRWSAARSTSSNRAGRRTISHRCPITFRMRTRRHRLRTILLVFFAITAVSLACVGLYGTLSYLVNLRRREVALRLALGAMRAQVVRQFLGLGVRVAVLGCVAGLLMAAGFARLLSGMLYGVSANDAVTVGGVLAIVLVVTVMASLIPAIRAARVEPMQALREE